MRLILTSEADGFGNVTSGDAVPLIKVRKGPGNPENAGIGSGGKVKAFTGAGQQCLPGSIRCGAGAKSAFREAGIKGGKVRFSGAMALDFTCCQYPLCHCR